MNDGHAAGDGHDGAGTRLLGHRDWLLGAAGRAAPPERSGAFESSVSGSVRVVP